MAGKERFVKTDSSEEQFGPVAKNFEVLTPEEFRQDFCHETRLALTALPNPNQNLALPADKRPSMGVEAMWIEFYGEHMRSIFESALRAAKAGLNVELHRDWYSDINLDQDFLFFHPFSPFVTPLKQRVSGFVSKLTYDELTHKRLSLLKLSEEEAHRKWVYGYTSKRLGLLEDAGAKIIPINVPETLLGKATGLLKGRDHKKIIFIKGPDRMAAWIGGMNLAEEHFRMLDFMVKIDDPAIVLPLIDEFKRVGENRRETNAKIVANDETTILIDTGKEESLIMQQAIEDIDSAQKTVYVSSAFRPEGKLLDALVRAQEHGAHVVWLTSSVHFTKNLFSAQNMLWVQAILSDLKNKRESKIPVMMPENAMVHAKALVVDEKSVIFGSHNFADMPHEELSLRSTNPTLVKNITHFLQQISGGNLDKELEADFIIPEKQTV